MRTGLILLIALVSVAAPATGQSTDPVHERASPVVADSVQVDSTFLYGLSRTYRAILSETVLLRLTTDAQENVQVTADPNLGIVGLVVDETLTPSGRLFYETFYLLWKPPAGAGSTSLTVGELPALGNGTVVVIRANGESVVQTRLPRRPEEIEALAQQAVAFVRQRLE